MNRFLFSQIVVTSDFETVLSRIKEDALNNGLEVISVVKDGNFLVSDVDFVLEKAHLTSRNIEIIVLGAKNFSDIVQNKLLKLLEEPPKNKIFILLFNNKASILKTIKSRLPVTNISRMDDSSIDIPNIENLTLDECYSFIQNSRKKSTQELKIIIQKIIKSAIKSKKYQIDLKALELFHNSVKALEYGAVGRFVLTAVLLKLVELKEGEKIENF